MDIASEQSCLISASTSAYFNNRVAGVVRERTRALIARAEDVAIAAMGELAAAASREATGGRRHKLPIY